VPTEGRSDPAPRPVRLSGAEAAKAHATLAVGLALCAVAFWFELGRALGGNSLSWAYVFEWPLFGVFAVYMWWNVLHGGRSTRSRPPKRSKPAVDPKYAGMLEAWTTHQRELDAAKAIQDAEAVRVDADRHLPAAPGSTGEPGGRAPA
jgi:hypothetical protein